MKILVLVVDDEVDIRELFTQAFRRDLRAGRFSMDFAHSGEEALARVEMDHDCKLILVLSDINMPGMTGLELLPKLRALRPDVPVVLITAYGDETSLRRALEAGAAGLLPKPLDFERLRQEIEGLLSDLVRPRITLAGMPSC